MSSNRIKALLDIEVKTRRKELCFSLGNALGYNEDGSIRQGMTARQNFDTALLACGIDDKHGIYIDKIKYQVGEMLLGIINYMGQHATNLGENNSKRLEIMLKVKLGTLDATLKIQ